MAKLVTREQRIVTGVTYPKSSYSRVLTLELSVPAGIAAEDWNYTEKVGGDVWLLGVDMWVSALTAGGECGGFFQISTGTEKPAQSGVIIMDWASLLSHQGIKPYPAFKFIEGGHLLFSMARHWTGVPRRFGVWIGNFSPTVALFALFAFEISEG